MTVEKLGLIEVLRRQNYSYSFIARELQLSINTVKSICFRKGFKAEGKRKTKNEKASASLCMFCHRPLPEGTRHDAKFCSSYCRTRWRRKNMKVAEKST